MNRLLRTLLLVLPLVALPSWSGAQSATTTEGAAPLSAFLAMRITVVPVQHWVGDSAGWSKGLDPVASRRALDSAITAELRDRGVGSRWAYAEDVVRAVKRNPTYATDPFALGTARWRRLSPKPGEELPGPFAENLRPILALSDARYAIVPVSVRAAGENAVLRLVMVDVRGRTVVVALDLETAGGAGVLERLAAKVADLVVAP